MSCFVFTGHDRAQRGFSLAEVLVALALTTMLFVVALSMLAIDQRIYATTDARDEVAREARHAIDLIERDLLMAGFQVDRNTIGDVGPDGTADTDDDIVGQSKIVYAAPWELVINADIAPRIDAIADGMAGDSLPSGYDPVSFRTGAETIRYTLDSNGDGTVDADDRGDEAEESIGTNDGLFLLRREVYGNNGTDHINPSGPGALVRGPVDYPSGAKPPPLFLYWGEFDPDPSLDLWGDDGTGSGIAGNGLLEPDELAALGPVTGEDLDGDAVLDASEDRNGNGRLERLPSELIKRIEVHITTETPQPDMRYTDPVRSSSSTPFRFRVVSLNTIIQPRNIDLPGGACGDVPEPTSSVSVVNACANALADGRVTLSWGLSDDDGGFENDVEKYLVYRTDAASLFGPTPFAETLAGVSSWQDEWIDVTAWPPRQYWYRLRAMDCTPQLSQSDPVAGPYPAEPGPAQPFSLVALDVPGDDGTQVEVVFPGSLDDPANTSGYGGNVGEYHVYRSTSSDVRCVEPVNKNAISAAGADEYSYLDDSSNSSSAPVLGELYHYWVRARDDSGRLSSYSARSCVRPSEGPVAPEDQNIRVVDYGTDDHPVELWFSINPRNTDAGYDQTLIEYRIYAAADVNGDSTPDSFVDYSPGYTANEQVAALRWTGLLWAVGDTAGAIHHSIDGVNSWRSAAIGATGRPLEAEFISRLVGVAVGIGGSIRRTDDGGVTWTSITSPVSANLRDVSWLDGTRVIAAGDFGTMVRSDDGGLTWSNLAAVTAENLRAATAQGDLVILAGDNGAVLRSTDGGATFNPVSLTSTTLYSACSASDAVGGVTVMLGEEDRIWRSTDGGATWSPVAMPGAGPIRALDCVSGGGAVAAAADSLIYVSGDGINWSSSATTGSALPTDAGMLEGGQIFVSDDQGWIHYYGPDGVWEPSQQLTAGSALTGIAVREEIAWEDSGTAAAASGTTHYYVVTASYSVGDPILDGESGMLPDRPSSAESPDENDPQILVDSCNNFELTVVTP